MIYAAQRAALKVPIRKAPGPREWNQWIAMEVNMVGIHRTIGLESNVISHFLFLPIVSVFAFAEAKMSSGALFGCLANAVPKKPLF